MSSTGIVRAVGVVSACIWGLGVPCCIFLYRFRRHAPVRRVRPLCCTAQFLCSGLYALLLHRTFLMSSTSASVSSSNNSSSDSNSGGDNTVVTFLWSALLLPPSPTSAAASRYWLPSSDLPIVCSHIAAQTIAAIGYYGSFCLQANALWRRSLAVAQGTVKNCSQCIRRLQAQRAAMDRRTRMAENGQWQPDQLPREEVLTTASGVMRDRELVELSKYDAAMAMIESLTGDSDVLSQTLVLPHWVVWAFVATPFSIVCASRLSVCFTSHALMGRVYAPPMLGFTAAGGLLVIGVDYMTHRRYVRLYHRVRVLQGMQSELDVEALADSSSRLGAYPTLSYSILFTAAQVLMQLPRSVDPQQLPLLSLISYGLAVVTTAVVGTASMWSYAWEPLLEISQKHNLLDNWWSVLLFTPCYCNLSPQEEIMNYNNTNINNIENSISASTHLNTSSGPSSPSASGFWNRVIASARGKALRRTEAADRNDDSGFMNRAAASSLVSPKSRAGPQQRPAEVLPSVTDRHPVRFSLPTVFNNHAANTTTTTTATVTATNNNNINNVPVDNASAQFDATFNGVPLCGVGTEPQLHNSMRMGGGSKAAVASAEAAAGGALVSPSAAAPLVYSFASSGRYFVEDEQEGFSRFIAAILREGDNTYALQGLLRMHGRQLVEQSDDEGRTALHHATLGGYVRCVQFLLSLGADPNIRDNNGEAPLHSAVSHRVLSKVRPASEQRYYTSRPSASSSATAGPRRRYRGGPRSRTRMPSRSGGGGANNNWCNSVVTALVKGGADVNLRTADGLTALHLAIDRGEVGVLNTLLRDGADPLGEGTTRRRGAAATTSASSNSCSHTVAGNSVRPSCTGSLGLSPSLSESLLAASDATMMSWVEVHLMNAGVAMGEHFSKSPLMYAAEIGCEMAVSSMMYALENDALDDPSIVIAPCLLPRCSHGMSALQVALALGNARVVREVLRHMRDWSQDGGGASISINTARSVLTELGCTFEGKSLFHFVALGDSTEALAFLLEEGYGVPDWVPYDNAYAKHDHAAAARSTPKASMMRGANGSSAECSNSRYSSPVDSYMSSDGSPLSPAVAGPSNILRRRAKGRRTFLSAVVNLIRERRAARIASASASCVQEPLPIPGRTHHNQPPPPQQQQQQQQQRRRKQQQLPEVLHYGATRRNRTMTFGDAVAKIRQRVADIPIDVPSLDQLEAAVDVACRELSPADRAETQQALLVVSQRLRRTSQAAERYALASVYASPPQTHADLMRSEGSSCFVSCVVTEPPLNSTTSSCASPPATHPISPLIVEVINACDDRGMTPLHYAIVNQNANMVYILCAYGARFQYATEETHKMLVPPHSNSGANAKHHQRGFQGGATSSSIVLSECSSEAGAAGTSQINSPPSPTLALQIVTDAYYGQQAPDVKAALEVAADKDTGVKDLLQALPVMASSPPLNVMQGQFVLPDVDRNIRDSEDTHNSHDGELAEARSKKKREEDTSVGNTEEQPRIIIEPHDIFVMHVVRSAVKADSILRAAADGMAVWRREGRESVTGSFSCSSK